MSDTTSNMPNFNMKGSENMEPNITEYIRIYFMLGFCILQTYNACNTKMSLRASSQIIQNNFHCS